jgi:uncharacterized protein
MADLAFNALMLAVDAAALLAVRRWPGALGVAAGGLLAAAAALGLAVAFALGLHWHPVFGTLRFAAWATFLHAPLLLLGGAALLRRRRVWRLGLPAAAAAVLAVAADAFLREPAALELRRYAIASAKVDRPLRIGVVADLQTDDPGEYERAALARLMAEKPDLVLFAGDYVHVLDRDERARQWDELNRLLREVGLSAPLGVYAVQGDVDPGPWERIFDGLGAELFPETRTVQRAGLAVTGLSHRDGIDTSLALPGCAGFHIAFGHRPDFALGSIDADLLVAGHTHGGQVALPFVGPLITMSAVPRAWAGGLTELPGGRTLVVSRGVGMERGVAPRLRFLCPPELVVIDVVPAAGGAGATH